MPEFLYLLSGSRLWSKEKLGITGSRACFGSDRPGPSWFLDNRGQPRVYRMLEGPEWPRELVANLDYERIELKGPEC